MVLTLRLIVLYGFLLWKALTDWSRIIEVESIYCAVRTEYLYKYKTERFHL
jgi:hypothetical protein